jgi:hypothetical protein
MQKSTNSRIEFHVSVCAVCMRCTLDVHSGKEFKFESFRYPNCTFVLLLETRYIGLHLFDARWSDMNQTPFVACFLDWQVHRAIERNELSMMASVVIQRNKIRWWCACRVTSDRYFRVLIANPNNTSNAIVNRPAGNFRIDCLPASESSCMDAVLLSVGIDYRLTTSKESSYGIITSRF